MKLYMLVLQQYFCCILFIRESVHNIELHSNYYDWNLSIAYASVDRLTMNTTLLVNRRVGYPVILFRNVIKWQKTHSALSLTLCMSCNCSQFYLLQLVVEDIFIDCIGIFIEKRSTSVTYYISFI